MSAIVYNSYTALNRRFLTFYISLEQGVKRKSQKFNRASALKDGIEFSTVLKDNNFKNDLKNRHKLKPQPISFIAT